MNIVMSSKRRASQVIKNSSGVWAGDVAADGGAGDVEVGDGSGEEEVGIRIHWILSMRH